MKRLMNAATGFRSYDGRQDIVAKGWYGDGWVCDSASVVVDFIPGTYEIKALICNPALKVFSGESVDLRCGSTLLCSTGVAISDSQSPPPLSEIFALVR